MSKINRFKLPSGLLAVYKPKGISSNAVVQTVKRRLTEGALELMKAQNVINAVAKSKNLIKVGHGGTLDPIATGVMVLGVGEGTKMLGSYLGGSKRYHTIGELGIMTDTLDSTGKVLSRMTCDCIRRVDIEMASKQFIGDIMQTPPMFSALKKDGQRLYELARKGKVVERERRKVVCYNISVDEESESLQLPLFGLDVECGGGFYIRSLISDIAETLDNCAHMVALERTKHGPFQVEDCVYEEDWNNYEKMVRQIEICTKKANSERI